jgi:hypothetical protein
MGTALTNIQSGLTSILNDIQLASPGNYRIAVVSFKDNITVHVNFALNNSAPAAAAINSLVAGGGNSPPEASDEALNTAVNALPTPGRPQNIDFAPGWRPAAAKIVILVTDALPAGFDDVYAPGVDDVNANNVALQAASLGIRIGAVYVPTGSTSPVPIMQNYASVTNGIYAPTQPNGVGTADAIRYIIAHCGNGPTATPTLTHTRTVTPTPGQQIVGRVTWQGRPTPPSALQQVVITLTLKSGTTEVNYPGQTTDSSGFFTCTVVGLPGGTYSWRVKSPKYLANSGFVDLAGAPQTNVEMGLMKAGDCNNDNVINVLDFNIVKGTFGKASGDPGYDGRGDLNGDNAVTVFDFNLVKGNFGTGGAPPTGPAN